MFIYDIDFIMKTVVDGKIPEQIALSNLNDRQLGSVYRIRRCMQKNHLIAGKIMTNIWYLSSSEKKIFRYLLSHEDVLKRELSGIQDIFEKIDF